MISAAQILREARRLGRLSQSELASRAGISQSVVSAYERGHREPSLATLTRLVEATGCRLGVDVLPPAAAVRGLPASPLGQKLRRHRRAILALADRSGADNVRVFGSVARGEDTGGSDIDLLIDPRAGVGLFDLIEFETALEELLGVEVDVVPAAGLKPWVRDTVLVEAIAL